jgi:hypothetical protein
MIGGACDTMGNGCLLVSQIPIQVKGNSQWADDWRRSEDHGRAEWMIDGVLSGCLDLTVIMRLAASAWRRSPRLRWWVWRHARRGQVAGRLFQGPSLRAIGQASIAVGNRSTSVLHTKAASHRVLSF